jgi:hypothetical protein
MMKEHITLFQEYIITYNAYKMRVDYIKDFNA